LRIKSFGDILIDGRQKIITVDTDWAPDWLIDYTADILLEMNVKSTWFITNESKSISKLMRSKELFELGIHPNMLHGSSHGKSIDEVMAHMKNILPDAISMRTHGLFQSTEFLRSANRDYGIQYDVSLFLPYMRGITPHLLKFQDCSICRIPYFWGDDLEMFAKKPTWDADEIDPNIVGIEIYNFHPIHVYLNTINYSIYHEIKSKYPESKSWKRDILEKYKNAGIGPQNMFLELVSKLAGKGTWVRELPES
jgi:hypothetical protein